MISQQAQEFRDHLTATLENTDEKDGKPVISTGEREDAQMGIILLDFVESALDSLTSTAESLDSIASSLQTIAAKQSVPLAR
jgi:hypothetical protein